MPSVPEITRIFVEAPRRGVTSPEDLARMAAGQHGEAGREAMREYQQAIGDATKRGEDARLSVHPQLVARGRLVAQVLTAWPVDAESANG